MSRVQCVRRLAGWQTSSTWRMGRDQGSSGRKRMQRGLLSLQSVLCSAGVPGYVTLSREEGQACCVPAAHILSSVIQFFESLSDVSHC